MWSPFRRNARQDKPARRTPPSYRPRLEALKDRCLLSAPGTLDPTFGSGGTVTTAVTKGSDTATGVLIQPNGDIIAYGGGNFALARYTPSGSLDPTFGSGGIVDTRFSNSGESIGPNQAALQADGKIVAVGTTHLVRYNSNGSLDNTFGNKGVVTLPSGADWNGALLLQPMSNGSEDIVVLGIGNGDTITLARYTPSGQLDTTFGSGGETVTNIVGSYWSPTALALENGDIVAGGTGNVGSKVYLLARYTANGSLDTTFGQDPSHPGIVTTPIGTGTVATDLGSLLVQSDGKIVAIGRAVNLVNSASIDAWGLARYSSDGSLDSTFGSGGIVLSNITPQGDTAIGSALQSNGEIVVAGWGDASPFQFEVGVYTSSGSPDTSFGSGGFVVQSFNSGSAAYGVAVQPTDGKIVAAGSTTVSGGKSDFFLARYIGTTTSAPATPLASTAMSSGSPLGTDSVLSGPTSVPASTPVSAASVSSASANVAGWSAFQASLLGTLERDLSQWEAVMTRELDELFQTFDSLFAAWDRALLEMLGPNPASAKA